MNIERFERGVKLDAGGHRGRRRAEQCEKTRANSYIRMDFPSRCSDRRDISAMILRVGVVPIRLKIEKAATGYVDSRPRARERAAFQSPA